MILFEEISKLIKQVQGKENMFGYQTTMANQTYLAYCLIGNIHFTKKLHWTTKYLWLSWHCIGGSIGLLCALLYILYGEKDDFTLLMHVCYLASYSMVTLIIIPATSYWFSDRIEQLIKHMDDLPNRIPISKDKQRLYINVQRSIRNYYYCGVTTVMIHYFGCFFDELLFYEEKKVKNYLYYPAPLPRLEEYANATFFFTFSWFLAVTTILNATENLTLVIFFKLWAASCYNEVIQICDRLEQNSEFYKLVYEFKDGTMRTINQWPTENQFEHELKICVDSLIQVNRRVKLILSFFEWVTTAVLTSTIIFQIAHVHTMIVQEEFSSAIVIKESSIFTSTAIITYQLCSTGEILDNMADVLSFEVYSLPWYIMPRKLREHILILLCQAQETVKTTAVNTYPINGKLYMRFLNAIYSTSNLLLKMVSK